MQRRLIEKAGLSVLRLNEAFHSRRRPCDGRRADEHVMSGPAILCGARPDFMGTVVMPIATVAEPTDELIDEPPRRFSHGHTRQKLGWYEPIWLRRAHPRCRRAGTGLHLSNVCPRIARAEDACNRHFRPRTCVIARIPRAPMRHLLKLHVRMEEASRSTSLVSGLHTD